MEQPVAAPPTGASHKLDRMFTQRRSSSALCGCTSLIMFLAEHSGITDRPPAPSALGEPATESGTMKASWLAKPCRYSRARYRPMIWNASKERSLARGQISTLQRAFKDHADPGATTAPAPPAALGAADRGRTGRDGRTPIQVRRPVGPPT